MSKFFMVDMKKAKLESLRRILVHEKEGGFMDSAVIGGLDLFLHRWTNELSSVLGVLNSYSVLTRPKRESWVNDVLVRLDGSDSPHSKVKARRIKNNKTSPTVALSNNVTCLSGISTQNLRRLQRLGVETVEDMLYLIPNRHNDFANICKVSELKLGEVQTVDVVVWETSETRHGPKHRSTQAILGDDTGNVRAIWFNNPYLAKTFRTGNHLVLSGKVNVFRGSFVFESPEYELLNGQENLIHTGRLVPVYPTVDGLPQRTLRRFVKQALDVGISQVVDYVPDYSRNRTGLMGLQDAISKAHYPSNIGDSEAARRRLAFDELLLIQLIVLSRRRIWQEAGRGIPLDVDTGLLDEFLDSLPFDLTESQTKVLNEILLELNGSRPMTRLLQGDVGSGKTVVAAAALLIAAFNGYQSVLLAPTEILAEQHFLTITNMLSGMLVAGQEDHLVSIHVGSFPKTITIGLLVGSLSKTAKKDMHQLIADGLVDLVIGTHALIQDQVDLSKLALAIVDEQHRFGVMQRASIRGKGRYPHILAMSATPIPRSLALTLYGDLDISVIDQLPPGRQAIRTRWVEPARRAAGYSFLEKQVNEGRQAFVVCPFIDESETIQTRAATEEYQRLSRDVFPDLKLGLLHGRMSLREKEQVMGLFKSGKLDILVSTPVVEVGIDVPNATVMLIDGADRFGLSQLHQFRGRVGRGPYQSYCLLLADSPGEEARERLKLVERIQDGFELAEEDLRLRGPGDTFGTRQSGIPNLRVARITDHHILTLARQEAIRILDSDPQMATKENADLSRKMLDISAGLTDEVS